MEPLVSMVFQDYSQLVFIDYDINILNTNVRVPAVRNEAMRVDRASCQHTTMDLREYGTPVLNI